MALKVNYPRIILFVLLMGITTVVILWKRAGSDGGVLPIYKLILSKFGRKVQENINDIPFSEVVREVSI